MTDGSLVPDDFDLEAAKNAHSSTPSDHQKRCPACGLASVAPKTTGKWHGNHREHDIDYFCRKCGAHFDEPDRGETS